MVSVIFTHQHKPRNFMNVGQEIYSQLLCHRNSLMCWGAKTFRTFSETSFTANLPHRGGLFFTVSGLKFKGKVMIRVLGSDLYHLSWKNG